MKRLQRPPGQACSSWPQSHQLTADLGPVGTVQGLQARSFWAEPEVPADGPPVAL